MAPGFDPSRVINGTFGYCYKDGIRQGNVNELEAKVAGNKKEIMLCGDLWTRHKLVGLKGTGKMTGYKATSDMIVTEFNRFEIISTLADPEAWGFERVRLLNVMVDEQVLAAWKAGEEVKEEIPFTFEGYELLDQIIQI